MSNYIAMQGRALGARLTNNVPGAFKNLLNLKAFDFGFKQDWDDHKETSSGQRLIDASISKGKEGTLDIEMDDYSPSNWGLMFGATVTEVAGSTATGEVIFPAVPAVGDIFTLDHGLATSVVITDSTGSPKTLVAGTHYRMHDGGKFGSGEILDITTAPGPFTGAVKAAYSYGAHTLGTMMTAEDSEYWMRFEGINTVDNMRYLYEFYRVKFSPADKASLVNDTYSSSKLSARILADASKAADPTLGAFGRIMRLGAA